MTFPLYLQNDNALQVIGLKDVTAVAGTYLNSATITATLKDSAGAAVAGASNLPLNYVAASNGNYNGVLANTVVLVESAKYTCVFDVTAGALKGHWEIDCVGRVRRA